MPSFLRHRIALASFAGAITALGCSLIVDPDESSIPVEPTTDTGVETSIDTSIDTGGPIDTGSPADTGTPDAADTAPADTADTATPDTADTAIADTAVADTATADTAGDATTVSFAGDVQPIFTARCTSCHSGSGASGGMSLAAGVARGNLVNVSSMCDSSVKRVVPFDTGNSMLWRKTAKSMICGSPMPLGSTDGLKVDAPGDFAKIETWIAEGALDN